MQAITWQADQHRLELQWPRIGTEGRPERRCCRYSDVAILYPRQRSSRNQLRGDCLLFSIPRFRTLACVSLFIRRRSPVFAAMASIGVLWPHKGTCVRGKHRHNPAQGEPLIVTERKTIPMNTNDRILRLPTVLARTGLSRSTLYRKIREGTFPEQVKISIHGAGWYESQINIWIADPVRYGRYDTLQAGS